MFLRQLWHGICAFLSLLSMLLGSTPHDNKCHRHDRKQVRNFCAKRKDKFMHISLKTSFLYQNVTFQKKLRKSAQKAILGCRK
jgi:hypothetical protein